MLQRQMFDQGTLMFGSVRAELASELRKFPTFQSLMSKKTLYPRVASGADLTLEGT